MLLLRHFPDCLSPNWGKIGILNTMSNENNWAEQTNLYFFWEKIDLEWLDHKREDRRKQKAMLIPQMELHHSPKSSSFEEVNTCWWALLLCWTSTVVSSQLPDFSGKPLLVSIPHTCSAESPRLKCVASTSGLPCYGCRERSLHSETARIVMCKGSYSSATSSMAQAEVNHTSLGQCWGKSNGEKQCLIDFGQKA